MPYPRRLQEVLEFFDTLTDEIDRANVLVEYAGKFRDVPPSVAVRPFDTAHRVPHCESEAYVWASGGDDGTMTLYFAVENPYGISAKALAAILDATLSNEAPDLIAAIDEEVVYRIFRRNISMGKGLGLISMVRMVAALARWRMGGSAVSAPSSSPG